MGLRETLNKNPTVWLGVLGLVAVAALLYFFVFADDGNYGEYAPAHYSVDDGQTFFVDDSGRLAPFEKDGKEAVMARVFEDRETGESFVAYLTKYASDADREAAEKAAGRDGGPAPLIKRPGDAEWIKMDDPAKQEEVAAIRRVRESPAGNPVKSVTPY